MSIRAILVNCLLRLKATEVYTESEQALVLLNAGVFLAGLPNDHEPDIDDLLARAFDVSRIENVLFRKDPTLDESMSTLMKGCYFADYEFLLLSETIRSVLGYSNLHLPKIGKIPADVTESVRTYLLENGAMPPSAVQVVDALKAFDATKYIRIRAIVYDAITEQQFQVEPEVIVRIVAEFVRVVARYKRLRGCEMTLPYDYIFFELAQHTGCDKLVQRLQWCMIYTDEQKANMQRQWQSVMSIVDY